MDIHDDTSNEGRVTRSRRRRLVSIDSDTSSRPSTPVINVKMDGDTLPKRTTRRNSITKTPSKSKDITIIDLATPSRSSRRLSQSITDLDTPQKLLKPQTPLTVLPEEDIEYIDKTNKNTKTTKVGKPKSPVGNDGKRTRRSKKIAQYEFGSDDSIEIIDISNKSEDEIEIMQTEAIKPVVKHEASDKNLNTSPKKIKESLETVGTPSKHTGRISQIQGQIDLTKNKTNAETPSKTEILKTNVENNEKLISRRSVVRLERMTQLINEVVIDDTNVGEEKNEKELVGSEQDKNEKSFACFEQDENANNPSYIPTEANSTKIDRSLKKPDLLTKNDTTPHAKVISVVIIPPIEDNKEKAKSPQKEESEIDTSNLSKSTNEQSKSIHSKSVTFENGENLDESKVSFPKTPAIRKNNSSSMASDANKRSLKLSDSAMEVDDNDYEKNSSSNTTEEHDKENETMATAEISFSKKSNTPQKSKLLVLESHCSTPNVPNVDNAVELKIPTPEKLLRSGKPYSPSCELETPSPVKLLQSGKSYSPSREINPSNEKEFENENITEKNASSLNKSNNSKIDGDENDANVNLNSDATINSIENSVQNKSMENSDNSLQTISTHKENLDSTKNKLKEEKSNSNSKDNELENPENSNEEEAIKVVVKTEKEDEENIDENEEKDRSGVSSNENNTAIENANGKEDEMFCEATKDSKVQENKILYSRTWMQSVKKNSSTKIDTLRSVNEKSPQKAKEINEEKFDYRLKLKEDNDSTDADEEIDEEERNRERNELVDDEAIDMGESYQSGDSMNEEEKEHAAEYSEIDDGESIGSKDTTDDEQEDDNVDEYNSFIIYSDDQDDEMKMLQYSDDNEHLNETTEKGKVYKRLKKLSSDSEDENADALTYNVTHMIDETLPNQYGQYNKIENQDAKFSSDEIDDDDDDDDNEKEKQEKKNEKEETNNRRRSKKTSLIHSNEKESEETEETGKVQHYVKRTTPTQKQRLSRSFVEKDKGKGKVGGEKSTENEYDKEYSMTDKKSQQSREDTCLNYNNNENTEKIESNKTDDSKEDKNYDESEEIEHTNVNSNQSDQSGSEENTNNKSVRYSLLMESEEGSPAKEKGNESVKKHRRSINDQHDMKSNVEEHSINFNRSRNNSLSVNKSRRSRKISMAESSNGFEETHEQNVSLNESKERESGQENSADYSSKENNFDNAEKKTVHGSRHSDLQYKPPNKKRADKAMRHKSLNETEHAVLLGNTLSSKKKSKSRNTSLMKSGDFNLENDDDGNQNEANDDVELQMENDDNGNQNEANDVEQLQMENNSDDQNSIEKHHASKIESRPAEEDNVERGNKKKAKTMKRQRSKSFIETTNESFSNGVLKKLRNRSCSITHQQYSHIDTEDTANDNSEEHITKKMKLSFEEITDGKTPKIQYRRTSTPFHKKDQNNENETQSNISKILDRCVQMLQVSENAKKSLRKNKPIKEKKRKSKTVREFHKDETTSTGDDGKRIALQQALKASQNILTRRNKKGRREQQESQNDENKYASKRLPADVLAAVSSDGESPSKMKKTKKKNSDESQQTSLAVYKTGWGDLVIESELTPPKPKKSKVEVIWTSSGEVRVEPITPMPKKIKDGFRESLITPQPTGWKMRQLLKSDDELNQAPLLTGRKRKRQTDRIPKTLEPNNSLPQPTWTKSAGNFKIDKIQQRMKVFKPTGGAATVFGVVALGESDSSGFKKKSRNDAAATTSSSFLSSTERAMNFRQNAVYRKNIVREDTKALLRRHRFVR